MGYEPIPGRVFDFTPEQQELIREIERKTGAEVVVVDSTLITLGDHYQCYEAFLSQPEKYLSERGTEWLEEVGELAYIRDQPSTEMMTQAELARYPDFIRRELPNEETGSGSCNILSTWCSDEDIGQLLQEMSDFTVLLSMGWHLGRTKDFIDPFIPEPLSEEEIIWQEYCEEKEAAQSEE